jgi:hypothetical protein
MSEPFRPLDHLEQFAHWFHQQHGSLVCPFEAVSFVGDFAQLVVSRHGQYQIQLGLAKPHAEIPDHNHPDVDTILVYLTGEIYFRLDGNYAWEWGTVSKLENGLASHRGRTLRVLPGQSHGASFGPAGGAFLSIQYWIDKEPRSVELNWVGPPLSEDHDRAINAGQPAPVP